MRAAGYKDQTRDLPHRITFIQIGEKLDLSARVLLLHTIYDPRHDSTARRNRVKYQTIGRLEQEECFLREKSNERFGMKLGELR